MFIFSILINLASDNWSVLIILVSVNVLYHFANFFSYQSCLLEAAMIVLNKLLVLTNQMYWSQHYLSLKISFDQIHAVMQEVNSLAITLLWFCLYQVIRRIYGMLLIHWLVSSCKHWAWMVRRLSVPLHHHIIHYTWAAQVSNTQKLLCWGLLDWVTSVRRSLYLWTNWILADLG